MASSVTPEEFANWLTPRQAVQILESSFGTGSDSYIAKHTLLELLRAGKLKAVAKEALQTGWPEEKLAVVTSEHWADVRENQIFWTNGLVSYSRRDMYGREREDFRFFGIRFDPVAVREIVSVDSVSAPNPLEEEPADDRPKGPDVSEAHLRLWFDLYQKTHQGSWDKLENAYKSAAGMFPGRYVSRQRIRDLAGGRKRGRKPESGQN
ncbi:MAG TPA: hypothetical protein VD863_14705 [Bradyrhizobium sp.]|nr:hypothetical protein [Bradyrhizobium sp.]